MPESSLPPPGLTGRQCVAILRFNRRQAHVGSHPGPHLLAFFIGSLLLYLPARILSWSGITRPVTFAALQLGGLLIGTLGAAIALWCISTFVVIGGGTPALFDPSRRLVVRGPYRFVRNPMYIGAALALAGAALFYTSVTLLGYSCVFLVATHLFVIGCEEPTLGRNFGPDYDDYRGQVRRWLPRFRV